MADRRRANDSDEISWNLNTQHPMDVANMTNGSGDDQAARSPWASGYGRLEAAGILGGALVIMVVIVVGNALVVAAVVRERRLRRLHQNWLIVSLAAADGLVGLLVMPLSLAYEVLGVWSFGWLLCELWLALDVLFVTSSILNLCAISLDRYLSLTSPMRYPKSRTRGRMGVVIAVVWLLSFLISFPPLVGFRPDREPHQCTLSTNISYVLYSALGSFYIPVILLLIVYARIFGIIRRRSQERIRENASRQKTLALTAVLSPIGKRRQAPSPDLARADADVSPEEHERAPFIERELPPRHKLSTRSFNRRGAMIEKSLTEHIVEESRNGGGQDMAVMGICETPRPLVVRHKSRDAGYSSSHTAEPSTASLTSEDGLPPRRGSKVRFSALADSTAALAQRLVRNIRFNSKGRISVDIMRGSRAGSDTGLEEPVCFAEKTPAERMEFKQRLLKHKERKATLSLSLILGSFIACWLPFFVLYFLSSFGVMAPEAVFKLAFWLGYCNSALNPVIYTALNKDFRDAFKKILGCQS